MQLQFANGRPQLPSPSISVTAGGTTTVSRSLYFALQGQNAAGCNLLSQIVGPVTIGVGQQLAVTLPSTIHANGEHFSHYVLSASVSNAPSSFVQIASIPAYGLGGAHIALPFGLTLSTDQHFTLSQIVASPAALPTSALISGMRRGVASLSFVFEYDSLSTTTPNSATALSAAPAPGRWLRVGGFSTIVTAVTDPGGCGQDVRVISPSSLSIRPYACNGQNGPGHRFWMVNDSNEATPSGLRVMIGVTLDEEPKSGLFEGLLRCIFRGYVNVVSGITRTTTALGETMRGLNQEILFENRKTDLILEDDLQPGEAYAIDIYPNLRPEFLGNQIANKSLVKVIVSLALQAGAFVEGGSAQGDRIAPVYDRGIVVPQKVGAKILTRAGMVNSRSFLKSGEALIVGFQPNLSQPVYLNSNGFAYLKVEPKNDTEAIRARVSLLAGTGDASPWSAPITVTANAGLNIACAYPSNGTTGTIRGNYPDVLLQGNAQGELNCQLLTLYVRSTVGAVVTIKKFVGRLIADGPTQSFQISDWASGVTIATVPAAPTLDFCLFNAVSAAAVSSGGGNLPAGTIEAAYAFELDGTQISSISHNTLDGCLHTMTLNQAEIEDAVQYWAQASATREALRAVALSKIIAYQARYVAEINNPYRYAPSSMAADDGYATLKPTAKLITEPGRWIIDDSNAIYLLDSAPTLVTPGEIGDIVIVGNALSADLGKLYQKTAFNTWTLKGSLRGPKGEAGIVPRGLWTTIAAYNPGDIVRRNGGAYVAIALNTSVDPATDTLEVTWQLYVEKGAAGTPGTNGINGAPGTNGAPGQTGAPGTVSAAGGLVIDQTAALSTTSSQIALRNDSGILKLQDANNGLESAISVLDKPQAYTKAQRPTPVTLTDAPIVAIDASLSNMYLLLLGGNRTLGNPSNLQPGTNFEIQVKKDIAGRALIYQSAYQFAGGTPPTLTAELGSSDILSCRSYDGLTLQCDLGKKYA